MKEYTLLAAGSLVLVFLADRLTQVRLLKKKLFYFFLLVILGFKFLVNGYLTGEGIVLYNRSFFLGARAGSIPLEDFIFGFSMVSLAVIFWEFFKGRKR
ncbi:MAG: lycopene cyclase domain-containing protein [Candidatus Omnitrophica bacterium]|nr:lycopene cyclase domain-containing protein [Candidatus Omnitrophota bacterium]MDD5042581.1 lycopene cyclase domain-containing protein [Candidatus Omnitrophota bacterium]MDD5501083.1 lycopene cyclase domain-containing protein [Candidatus Omnitrophota bacterium]